MELMEPKELDFLNFKPQYKYAPQSDIFEHFTIVINISSDVFIQKRIVYDVLTMLGDVGGLNEFVLSIFAAIIGFFSNSLMVRSLIEKFYFFHAGKPGKQSQADGL